MSEGRICAFVKFEISFGNTSFLMVLSSFLSLTLFDISTLFLENISFKILELESSFLRTVV